MKSIQEIAESQGISAFLVFKGKRFIATVHCRWHKKLGARVEIFHYGKIISQRDYKGDLLEAMHGIEIDGVRLFGLDRIDHNTHRLLSAFKSNKIGLTELEKKAKRMGAVVKMVGDKLQITYLPGLSRLTAKGYTVYQAI